MSSGVGSSSVLVTVLAKEAENCFLSHLMHEDKPKISTITHSTLSQHTCAAQKSSVLINLSYNQYIQYQSNIWTNLLMEGRLFVFTVF